MPPLNEKLAVIMQQALNEAKTNNDGENASYIPFLASVPSELTGLAFVSVTGEIIQLQDCDYKFAIESISKIMTLGLVLEQSGADALHSKVGAEPTGMPFNSVLALELHNGKPLTPLVNAGAMATVSLVKATDKEQRWQQILNFQSLLANSEISLSDEVNQSEQTTNTHNRAIALLLESSGRMYSEPLEACDVYTRQCSTLFNTVELATVGATLANGGKNPCSGQQVIDPQNIPHILAEMVMEGLYDTSGDWAYDVGLPAKSGVGGGLVTVIPNVGALAAFSPRLDPFGNSIRGQQMIKHVTQAMAWNLFSSKQH
ncbi:MULTISPECIES: glutaminase A [unclassified Photobacterium]|uniref:glutaminase A n=1 Tax=unclassified Photobacterium TaxID=2628852 RepID=UPI000D16CA18|nr:MULTISPECIES: glutaminase A [unclassified Photobacterium]PSV24993.1 glutaminase [Photobacterium sp. GB-56]PSV26080.1 glutaminase [Photobacterium sp. GB-72]PSV29738.1 glutaminase [Photobacterium sp. GB-27]PSV35904.1 glutaminase [Photobacterium sp. GB-210]PSV42709.1 glutaminase [Photobacterium sp. GB-36]